LPSTVSNSEVRTSSSLAESLGRSLRHELGDFLQKVYASVAILETRMPGPMEREILGRLRARAEDCRRLLDAIQDFLCPLQLTLQPLDLASMASQWIGVARERFPNLQIKTEANGSIQVTGDPERISRVGEMLLANACEAARSEVILQFEVDPESGDVQFSVHDDGGGISPDVSSKLFRPFTSSRPGHVGLGLALAQKLVLLHGGRITLDNRSKGGCTARVWLPAHGPAEAQASSEEDTKT
jgi:two-component system, LuxR family, sensor kinase FixL